jgi:hypothetical protein
MPALHAATGIRDTERREASVIVTSRFQTWDRLPLFADEEAISGALMGPGKIAEWRQIAPLLERRGLPTVDGLLGGRYTPALKAFFDREYDVHGESQVSAPHVPAEFGEWKKKGRRV